MRLREAILADLPRLSREAEVFDKINIHDGIKGGRTGASASRWIAVDDYVRMHLHSGAGEQWRFKMTQPVLLSACLVQGNQHRQAQRIGINTDRPRPGSASATARLQSPMKPPAPPPERLTRTAPLSCSLYFKYGYT